MASISRPGILILIRIHWRSPNCSRRALTEGLRMELHSQNIRCTMISPGAVATELPESSSEEATRKNLREFLKMAIPASAIARAIAYAIEQPVEVEVDEMVIRPTVQDF
jgi:NADP-dependent 3-hydroxy acid dehydrogenase YdfG